MRTGAKQFVEGDGNGMEYAAERWRERYRGLLGGVAGAAYGVEWVSAGGRLGFVDQRR